MKITQAERDNLIKIISVLADKRVTKALIPINEKLTALQVENAALREAIKGLREVQELASITPEQFRARYAALQ